MYSYSWVQTDNTTWDFRKRTKQKTVSVTTQRKKNYNMKCARQQKATQTTESSTEGISFRNCVWDIHKTIKRKKKRNQLKWKWPKYLFCGTTAAGVWIYFSGSAFTQFCGIVGSDKKDGKTTAMQITRDITNPMSFHFAGCRFLISFIPSFLFFFLVCIRNERFDIWRKNITRKLRFAVVESHGYRKTRANMKPSEGLSKTKRDRERASKRASERTSKRWKCKTWAKIMLSHKRWMLLSKWAF